MLRQPIVCVLGHVDHGKTTLLDRIRGTAVASKEAGGITQHVGCTSVPAEVIKKISGPLLKGMNIRIEVPGLLFLDTPGHEAFTTLRKRGGALADLAVLVVDVNEGFRPQTVESLGFLKQFRTPFVVAATKIDKIKGWVSGHSSFLESWKHQSESSRALLEQGIYEIVARLSEEGFDAERFDRVKDFKKTVAIIPCSGVTGEGIPELLTVLCGLAQAFLKERIRFTGEFGRGSVLEIKEVRGLGTTADVLLYDGILRKGDTVIFSGKEPVVTRIRALLKPRPLSEIRAEKRFEPVNEVVAACGVKISAPDLEKVKPGSVFISATGGDLSRAMEELERETEAEFELEGSGVVVKADTVGSLEAVLKLLKERGVKVKKAEVGPVHKSDVAILSGDPLSRVVFAFNVPIDREAYVPGVKFIQGNVIYRLIEEYEEWVEEEKRRIRDRELGTVTSPAVLRVLEGFVFRVSEPAVFGVEVLEGCLKPGCELARPGKIVGRLKEIQKEGRSVDCLEAGERAAISVEGGVVGRNIKEGDELFTVVTERDVEILKKYGDERAGLAETLRRKLSEQP